MTDLVGIVIVSHSIDIAKGINDMVRQIAGSELKVAFCFKKRISQISRNQNRKLHLLETEDLITQERCVREVAVVS